MSEQAVMDRKKVTERSGTGNDFNCKVKILDTDYNTFQQVIQGCLAVIPQMSLEKAKAHANTVHNTGEDTVWEGPREMGEFFAEQLAADPFNLKAAVA